MAEYIERDAAKKKHCEICMEECICYRNKSTCNDLKAFDLIPAADVRPVVKGKWIDHQEGRWIYAKCSECGTVHDVKSNFCPNCGADMMEES